jgi:enoyl-CoA hydratase/carnithine racemase
MVWDKKKYNSPQNIKKSRFINALKTERPCVMDQIPHLTDSTLQLNNRVAILTFGRDDVRNALTGTALICDILKTASWVNACQDVSVLIITGAGKAFSAGGNIKDMANRTGDFAGDAAEIERRYRTGIQQIPLAMEKIEVPVIAAVNGAAIGAGFDLANMADMRFAAEDAKFGETFLNLGIIPGDGGAWFLQRQIGYQKAAELTFTGRIISAQEAFDMGLVLNVYPTAQLIPNTLDFAEKIAKQPPEATRRTKRLLKAANKMQLPEFLDFSACFQGMCHNSAEHAAAMQAFIGNNGKDT